MLSNLAQKHTNSQNSLLQKTNLRPIFLCKKKTYYGRNTSNIEWKKEFGKKQLETDENNNKIEYEYDPYGRLVKVWSPYDFKLGTPAVEHEYNTEDTNWYAVTYNKILFDSDNSDTLMTVIATDSLGRVLYTAKQGEYWNNGSYPLKGWNVSGFTAYDEKGRSVATGQPLFIDGTDHTKLHNSIINYNGNLIKNPTIQEYDSIDRVTKTTLPSAPGETVEQTTSYEIRNGRSWTKTIDPLKNESEQATDSRGNIVTVRRLDKEGTVLTTATYEYNGLGEMLSARDAQGNPLTVTYDRLGRRTRMESADIGVKEWWYDNVGNLLEESDSALTRRGARIKYEYDGMNRLTKINYPFSTPTVYTYGNSNASNNAAGRITSVTDESGTIQYKYGSLGEVIEEDRRINLLGGGITTHKEAVIKYRSDYLGRMQEIIYPDGEKVTYAYNYGGQIQSVKGERGTLTVNYVKDIGYDEFGQRVYIEYNNGVYTNYTYNQYRRWLSNIKTGYLSNPAEYQNIDYNFNEVGNLLSYTNNAYGYSTTQKYSYDGLYQLTGVTGESKSHPFGSTQYITNYSQNFAFDNIGNMTSKTSTEETSTGARVGDNLNYNLDYTYYAGTHKAERIGTRYYSYDLNGNVIAEKEGSHATNPEIYRPYHQDGEIYTTDYGFGIVRPGGNVVNDGAYQRNYRWNERNLLSESSDASYTVHYRYGADGQRALKYVSNTSISTLYFNKMWQITDDRSDWVQSKHIYLGEDRIATKYNSEGNTNTGAERERVYYYHTDHLGSAQTITNYNGALHERLEYTPYGELWIDWQTNAAIDSTPFRFTAKELDKETGLYYYGSRYLDPKISRWLSIDPALTDGSYIPVAPNSDEARKHNQNLPGMGGVFNYVNLHVYHYSANNPVKYVDPNGREIKVQIHSAFYITPFYHASIRITLDTDELRSAFKNSEIFQEYGQLDSNGNMFITIGGERDKDGKLVGRINRDSDVARWNKRAYYIVKGNDKIGKYSEVVAVRSILNAFEEYKDNLDYGLFPNEDNNSYNSNSYISGILEDAELPVHNFIIGPMPGWNKPIPIGVED